MAVTIAGQPVLIDNEQQAASFVESRIPPCDILFARHEQRAPLNPYTQCGGLEWLESPYPSLPDVKIGQMQWPSGASRYARALYLVDGDSLRTIMQQSYQTDPMRNAAVDFDRVPDDWGFYWNPVELRITDDRMQAGILHNTFTAKMYPLPPYRIPGHDAELFALPLVCKRFKLSRLFASANAFDSQSSELEWSELFSKYASDIGETVAVDGLVDADWITPHADLYRSVQPALLMLDVAALSVGLRATWLPDESGFAVHGSVQADTARNVRFSYPDRTAGGKRGAGALPHRIDVQWRNGDTGASSTASHTVSGVSDSYVQDVHTAWFADGGDDSEGFGTTNAETLAQSIARSVRNWGNCGGYYSHAGAMQYRACGYDDYFLIECLESIKGYCFSTRVQELPAPFLPSVFMQGQDRACDCTGAEHLSFQLQTAWAGGIALAYMMTMDQEFITDNSGSPVAVVLRDPQVIFDFLRVGQRGYMIKQDCKYYAWQADCDGPVYPIPIPEGE